MARVVPEDPFAGLADTAMMPPQDIDLALEDPGEQATEVLIARAEGGVFVRERAAQRPAPAPESGGLELF